MPAVEDIEEPQQAADTFDPVKLGAKPEDDFDPAKLGAVPEAVADTSDSFPSSELSPLRGATPMPAAGGGPADVAEGMLDVVEHPFNRIGEAIDYLTLPKGVKPAPMVNPLKLNVDFAANPALAHIAPELEGAQNVLNQVLDPNMALQLMTGTEAVKAVPALAEIPHLIPKAIVSQMGAQLPAQAANLGTVLGSDASPAEKKKAVTEFGLQAAMVAAGAYGASGEPRPPGGAPRATIPESLPRAAEAAKQAIAEESPEKPTTTEVSDASKVGKTAEVHGDVQSFPIEGEGGLPKPEGVGGVLPQAAGGLPEAAGPQPASRKVQVKPVTPVEPATRIQELSDIPLSEFNDEIKKTGFKGITNWAYDFGSKLTTDQIPAMQAAADKAVADFRKALAEGKPHDQGMKKQFFTEAIKMRRAIDEAVAAGKDADIKAIASKHGVAPDFLKDAVENNQSKEVTPDEKAKAAQAEGVLTPPKLTAAAVRTPGGAVETGQPVKKPTKAGGSWTKWSYHPSGANDLLDDIFEEGGIATPSQSKFATKGDYDGYKSAFGTGMAVRLRRSSGGLRPDDLMQALEKRGHHFESTSDFYDKVEKAAKQRQAQAGVKGGLTPAEVKEVKLQQLQGEDFQESVIQGKGAANPPKLAGDVVKKPGDTFTVQGQKFTVENYDPESDTYIVEDGQRFGRQYLKGEETIHPDPTIPKLKPGQQTADLIDATQRDTLSLVGEKGTDADRIAAMKAQAAKDAAEAKAKQDKEQQGFEGMGGAVPAEFETHPGTPTSIKNAVVDQERAKRGLPEAMAPLRRSFGDVWDKAMAHIDNDPAWLYSNKTSPGLIEELKRKPRALTDEEDAALLYHQVDLQNEYGKATRDLAQHFEDGNEGMAQEAKLRVARLSDDLLDLYNIGKRSGTETARGLNARKMMAMEDFTLAKMELDKRSANGGRRLTESESAEVARLNAKIESSQKAYDDYVAQANARIADMEVKAALDRVKLEAAQKMDPVIKRIVTRIGDALHSQRDAAMARIKARGSNITFGSGPLHEIPNIADYAIVGASHLFDGALGLAEWSQKMVADFGEGIKPHLDQIFTESNKRFDEAVDAAAGRNKPRAAAAKKAVRDPAQRAAGLADLISAKVKEGKRNEITMLVQRLARTFVERGVDDRDDLIDKVHGVLSQIDPTMTRREAMDAISGYGDFKQLTKNAISVELRDLKGQMQQVAKLEDMQAGQPPLKTGLERRTPSAEESRLIKAVNEAKRQFQIPVDDPNTQLKSALDTLKTRLRNRTAELQQKIAEGDFAPRERRELKLDDEATRLKAENERAKEEFRRNVMKDRLKQRTPYEKVADAWVKIRRAFILSAPTTLAKLTSAAVQRIAFTPLEELAGAGYSSIFPAVAKRASREGGLSTKAEAKALTEGFTKGMKDAWDVLRTGRSELDVVYGKDRGYPQEWINFMGNIHGALKTVTKRAEFARSLQKRAESAMNGGVDVTDPMVQSRLALDAYKDANRSIFMQDNRVVSAYKRFLSALDEPEKSTGHVPLGRKVAGMTARTLLPIVKIPTNIVAETFQYATGLVTGSARLAKAYHDGIENLKPEEADLIMRHLKKGSLGGAVLLLGFFSPNLVGGYYQQGEKRKKGDVKYGSVRVFGHDIPSFLLHNPLLETLQIGATIRRVADSKLKKRDKDPQGIAPGVMAGGLGLAEEVPFVREMTEVSKAFNPRERGQFTGELGRSLLVPQAVQWIAEHTDKDARGNLIARQPKTAAQRVEVGIPGLRKNVPKNPKQPQP